MAKKGEIGAKKATVQEAIDRTDFACTLLRKGLVKWMVKRGVAGRYNISPKMAEVYIGRARKFLLEESGRPANEHRADAYGLYVTMIENKSLPPLTRLRAQELMVKLLGIEGPVKYAQTDTQGNDIATNGARATFNRIAVLLDDAIGSGGTPSSNGSNGSAHDAGAAS